MILLEGFSIFTVNNRPYYRMIMNVEGLGSVEIKDFSISDELYKQIEKECLIIINKRLGREQTE